MPSGIFTKSQVNQAIQQGSWSGYIRPKWVEYLVVAGGGGGGGYTGAGAGGLLQGIVAINPNSTYTVTVGAGGNYDAVGASSVFGAITTTGGGTRVSTAGGSGSGGWNGPTSNSVGPAGLGIPGQGNNGGYGRDTGSSYYGGGGGGAGSPGQPANTGYCGNGGTGITSDITGARVVYAGGGGGGQAYGGNPGLGGEGGGGAGGDSGSTYNGYAGGQNRGGGGGGSSYGPPGGVGGTGGSGIVVVRYPGTVQFFTGGVVSYANGYVIHTFNSSGTLSPIAPTLYVDPEYQISRSLRFNSADSAYLSRTPSSASNRRTFTVSFWIKKGNNSSGSYKNIFGAAADASNRADILWHPGDNLRYYDYNNSFSWFASDTYSGSSTAAVFRDNSAWMHFVLAVDSTQALAKDRIKGYINGVFVPDTAGGTCPLNAQSQFNNNVLHTIGSHPVYGQYIDGYLTDFYLIDGQALTPYSFGYTNPNTGQWQPIRYTGSYGTNGFFLNFSDNSNVTATTLGKDYSGNGNNYTPTGFSVAAGVGNDSVVDTPTNYGTDNGNGGEVRGNYCTLNPLSARRSFALSNGNLDGVNSGSNDGGASGTMPFPSTGKWYYEARQGAINGQTYLLYIGLINSFNFPRDEYSNAPGAMIYPRAAATCFFDNTGAGSCITENNVEGDVFGVAYDADTNVVDFYKNGVKYVGRSVTVTSGITYYPFLLIGNQSVYASVNFGQRPWQYPPPAGYKALCTQNIPDPTIGTTGTTQAKRYFNGVLYRGNSGVNPVTGMGFQPDILWNKSRSTATNHAINDSTRGINRVALTNSNQAEITGITYLTSFDGDGFTANTDSPAFNYIDYTYVAYGWKTADSSVTNTNGQITSTVRANPVSGVSAITFTTDGTTKTVGHGLPTKPSVIIAKVLNGAGNWILMTDVTGSMQYSILNGTAAFASIAYSAPTSTVFQYNDNNGNTQVAYCFSQVKGFSKFGTFLGNGSTDGPFIHTDFKPRWILIKNVSNATWPWVVVDTVRNNYNTVNNYLSPNNNNAEATNFAGGIILDSVSNGFKIRSTDAYANTNGETIFYMAFAEAPFKYSTAR